MNTFKACLKKEYLEQIRTHKFMIYSLIAVGMVAFSLVTIAMLQIMSAVGLEMGPQFAEMFKPTINNGTMMLMSFMSTYFYIPVIIMLMSCVSKEISQKKWTLPISSGISPSKMIGAKFIVTTASVLLASVIAFTLNLILSMIFLKTPSGFSAEVLFLLRQYGMFFIFTIFLVILTISMNAMTKKSSVTILVSLGSIILFPTILGAINVGGKSLINYTPFMFLSELSGHPKFSTPLSAWEWIISSITLVGLSAILLIFAIKKTSMRKEKE